MRGDLPIIPYLGTMTVSYKYIELINLKKYTEQYSINKKLFNDRILLSTFNVQDYC